MPEKRSLRNPSTTEEDDQMWRNHVIGDPLTFDVFVQEKIATIGEDPDGTLNPYQAAFLAIANADRNGTYTFTIPGIGTEKVTVERQQPLVTEDQNR